MQSEARQVVSVTSHCKPADVRPFPSLGSKSAVMSYLVLQFGFIPKRQIIAAPKVRPHQVRAYVFGFVQGLHANAKNFSLRFPCSAPGTQPCGGWRGALRHRLGWSRWSFERFGFKAALNTTQVAKSHVRLGGRFRSRGWIARRDACGPC